METKLEIFREEINFNKATILSKIKKGIGYLY